MNNFTDSIKKLPFPRRYEALSALIVITCLAVFAMNANPFAEETVAPFDRLLQFAGWSTIPSDRTAVHAERSDILDSQLPAWITLKDQIRRGETPLWYPNGAGGQPVSLELCNPGFLIFAVIEDNALAYYVVGLVKLVVSGFGTYLLLRIFLGWLPSLWGGAAFMLCGFNAAWFFWEQVTTSMWIPWLLWATAMHLESENRKWLPVITLTSLLLIFGGFPPVAAFGFYAFVLLVLVWSVYSFVGRSQRETDNNAAILRQIMKKAVLLLPAVGLSFVLAAVTLIPFRDTMAGINLGVRVGGTPFEIDDLLLFLFYEHPPQVEKTAYVGIPVFFFSLVGIFSAFRADNEKVRSFIFINVFFVVVSVLIAFGLLPGGLIRAIPVFGSNNWGRLVVITHLGLAALSSVGLDFILRSIPVSFGRYLRLTPPNARRAVIALLVIMTAFQVYSQKRLFNNFNAVVPSSWFYPLTPSITYVKQHLQPLQSVLADASSYWFAGTLGAYGIPEWFAHSFRTDREKELLGELAYNRSKSPTTMVIDGKSIHFDSALMDKLAIKYLLVNKNVGNALLLELPEMSREPAPSLPSNSWRQHIYIPKDIIAGGIGFSFNTYGEKHAPAGVRLTLTKDNEEKYFAEAGLAWNEITEEEWGFFNFPNALPLKKGGYSVQVSLPSYSGPGRLTAWATKTRTNADSFLEVNGAKTDLSLIWKIGYFEDVNTILKKWNMISLENDIVIYENRQVTNNAYFVEDLAPSSEADFSGLAVRRASVDLIEIHNSHADAGWIVLPMRFHPDWKAYIDNRRVDFDTYLDVMPAIPVTGPGQVTFKYEPSSLRKGLAVSLAGVFIFLVFSGFCFKKDKRSE